VEDNHWPRNYDKGKDWSGDVLELMMWKYAMFGCELVIGGKMVELTDGREERTNNTIQQTTQQSIARWRQHSKHTSADS